MIFPFNLIKVNTSIYAEEKKKPKPGFMLNTLFEQHCYLKQQPGQKTVFSHDILYVVADVPTHC